MEAKRRLSLPEFNAVRVKLVKKVKEFGFAFDDAQDGLFFTKNFDYEFPGSPERIKVSKTRTRVWKQFKRYSGIENTGRYMAPFSWGKVSKSEEKCLEELVKVIQKETGIEPEIGRF